MPPGPPTCFCVLHRSSHKRSLPMLCPVISCVPALPLVPMLLHWSLKFALLEYPQDQHLCRPQRKAKVECSQDQHLCRPQRKVKVEMALKVLCLSTVIIFYTHLTCTDITVSLSSTNSIRLQVLLPTALLVSVVELVVYS